MKYSLIIPTYNEKKNIPILISMINSYLTEKNIEYEIIIVDDNSPDETYKVIETLIPLFNNKLKLLKRPGKMGLGSAYIDGFSLTEGEYIFLLDADFSHHPKFLYDFIEKQQKEKSDIVTGSRYIGNGGVYGWSLKRKIISRGANFFSSFFLKPHVSDLTGSFRLYSRKAFETLLKKVKNIGYAFQMEIIIRAQYEGFKISEVPITFVDRIHGESKLTMKEIFLFFQTVLKLYYEL